MNSSFNMTFEELLKLVQIIFYLTAGTVAVLTYLSAKRGLLNTINTEYHKRAFDKLDNLSQDLFSEFDPDSPNYWAKHNTAHEMVEEIYLVRQNEEGIIEMDGYELTGLSEHNVVTRLNKLLQKTKSDPFLPAKIRDFIAEYLERRSVNLLEIFMQEFQTYYQELAQGVAGKDFQKDANKVHNRIIDRLYKDGYGITQTESKVHEIRKNIQAYLEGFNPIKLKN